MALKTVLVLTPFILKINWFAKIYLHNVLILSKDEAKLVFKDISSSLL